MDTLRRSPGTPWCLVCLNPFSRGQIYALLRNPIYIGKIRHKAKVWDGQHDAIVDIEYWDRVQDKLQAASVRPRSGHGSKKSCSKNEAAALTSKLRDETGDRLTPTNTKRRGRQLRYYTSNRLISGGTDPQGWRLPAGQLEQAVADVIAKHIGNLARGHRLLSKADLLAGDAIRDKALGLAERLLETAPELIRNLVSEGSIGNGRITLILEATELANELSLKPDEIDATALQIEAPFALRRRGVEGKIVVGDREPEPDQTLLRALARAHAWTADLRTGKPLSKIAARTSHSESYIRTRAQLAFLSPAIQKAIFEGRQPPDLTLERIVRKPIPLDWDRQAKLYGFDVCSGHP
ncbi:recombinase family protein [Actibacterium sp. D379-3]